MKNPTLCDVSKVNSFVEVYADPGGEIAGSWQKIKELVEETIIQPAGAGDPTEKIRRLALEKIATAESSGDWKTDLGCIRAIARMALEQPAKAGGEETP